jgi:hypothetical protein
MLSLDGLLDLLTALRPQLQASTGMAGLWAIELEKDLAQKLGYETST